MRLGSNPIGDLVDVLAPPCGFELDDTAFVHGYCNATRLLGDVNREQVAPRKVHGLACVLNCEFAFCDGDAAGQWSEQEPECVRHEYDNGERAPRPGRSGG